MVSRAERTLQWDALVDLLRYDWKTGEFTTRIDDYPAGYVGRRGYVVVRIDGMNFLAHRLAWFYMYRFWPRGEVHHKNEVKTDNMMSNLEMLSKADHRRRHPENLRYGSKLGEPRIFRFAPNRSDAIGVIVRILTPMGYGLAFWPDSLPGEGYQVVTSDRIPVTDCMSLRCVEQWIEVEQERLCGSDISVASNMAGISSWGGVPKTMGEKRGSLQVRLHTATMRMVGKAIQGNEIVIDKESV